MYHTVLLLLKHSNVYIHTYYDCIEDLLMPSVCIYYQNYKTRFDCNN